MNQRDKNTPPKAVALQYDGKNAPKVTAKGTNEIAEQIIALAREHSIPIFENPDLLTLLGQLDLGDEIPQLLYRAVAEVIAFAYILTGKIPENYKPDRTSDS
jgi:flagellar biosynthesis protein